MTGTVVTAVTVKEAAQLWFGFVRALMLYEPVRLAYARKFYGRWGDVCNVGFEDWWRANEHRFREVKVALGQASTEVGPDVARFEIPLTAPFDGLESDLRSLLAKARTSHYQRRQPCPNELAQGKYGVWLVWPRATVIKAQVGLLIFPTLIDTRLTWPEKVAQSLAVIRREWDHHRKASFARVASGPGAFDPWREALYATYPWARSGDSTKARTVERALQRLQQRMDERMRLVARGHFPLIERA